MALQHPKVLGHVIRVVYKLQVLTMMTKRIFSPSRRDILLYLYKLCIMQNL